MKFFKNFNIFFLIIFLLHKNLTVKCKNVSSYLFKRRSIRSNYIGSRNICDFEKIIFCNEHNLPHLCICYIPHNILDVKFFKCL